MGILMMSVVTLSGCGVQETEININEMFKEGVEVNIERSEGIVEEKETGTSVDIEDYQGSGISASSGSYEGESTEEMKEVTDEVNVTVDGGINIKEDTQVVVEEVKIEVDQEKIDQAKNNIVKVGVVDSLGLVDQAVGVNVGDNMILVSAEDIVHSIGVGAQDTTGMLVPIEGIIGYDINLNVIMLKGNNLWGKEAEIAKDKNGINYIVSISNGQKVVTEPSKYSEISNGVMINGKGEFKGLKINDIEVTVDRMNRFIEECRNKEIGGMVYKKLTDFTGLESELEKDMLISILLEQ